MAHSTKFTKYCFVSTSDSSLRSVDGSGPNGERMRGEQMLGKEMSCIWCQKADLSFWIWMEGWPLVLFSVGKVHRGEVEVEVKKNQGRKYRTVCLLCVRQLQSRKGNVFRLFALSFRLLGILILQYLPQVSGLESFPPPSFPVWCFLSSFCSFIEHFVNSANFQGLPLIYKR